MKRYAIKQGHNTLTITLPAKWVKDKNIRPSQELDIIERGSDLIIIGENKKEHERKTFSIDNATEYLDHYPNNIFLRFIEVNYRQGYNEIKITFNDAKALSYIEEQLEFVLGFEIVEQGENYCIIRNIAAGLEEEFSTVLKRVMLMLISMMEDIYDVISKGEFSRLRNIKRSEKINNKLTNFCERLLNQKEFPDYRKTKAVYVMITLLEQIADDCNGICTYLEQFKNKEIKISKQTVSYFKEAIDFIKTFYELFYKFDRIKLWELMKDRYYLDYRKYINLLTGQPKHEIALVHHIASIIEKGHHLTEALD